MIEVKITVNSVDELNKEIAILAENLQVKKEEKTEGVEPPLELAVAGRKKKINSKQVEKPVETPVEVEKAEPVEPEKVAETEIPAEEISQEDAKELYAKIKALSAKLVNDTEKKAEVRDLLKSINVNKISLIPENKYPYILKGLEAI